MNHDLQGNNRNTFINANFQETEFEVWESSAI
jgi:hypothetical protein